MVTIADIRLGEVAVTLPAQADASLYFIGRIRTPWRSRKDCPKNAREARETGAVCTIEVDPRWAQALAGVETCSHLIVLYWMDQARFRQELEMARDARLRLPQNLGQVGNRQLGLGQQHQHPQARILAGGLERGVQGIEWQMGRIGHGIDPIV